jgi:hypothetical protein
MKAEDIPETTLLELIRQNAGAIGCPFHIIANALPDIPAKVLRAKLRSLIKRSIITGCADNHECRGDYAIRQ